MEVVEETKHNQLLQVEQVEVEMVEQVDLQIQLQHLDQQTLVVEVVEVAVEQHLLMFIMVVLVDQE